MCFVSCAFALTSCVTTNKTAKTADFSTETFNATVADLEVSDKRVTATLNPVPAEVRRGGMKNIKKTVEAKALEENGNADVLVNPEFTYTVKRGFFSKKVTSMTVTGRPAKYKNFHSLNDSVWSNPAFRGVVVRTGSSAYRPKSSFKNLSKLNGNSSKYFTSEKANQPVTFGIRGGLNVSSMSLKDDGDLKSRAGFNVGVSVDFPILESFYLQSGLYYTVKGYKQKDGDLKVNIGYLEIPILASYRHNFSDAAQWQFNFGPYFAVGLNGNLKAKYSWREYEKKWYDYDATRRFDMGLQIGTGVVLAKHYYVGLAYELGFLSQVTDSDGYCKNRNFMVNVGYQF